jgi:hypothetical protein
MTVKKTKTLSGYNSVLSYVAQLLETARSTSVRATNAIMPATYWEIGRRIVEYEQEGQARAEYGKEHLKRLAFDLTSRFGRGFGVDNLQRFRVFYLAYPPSKIYATVSRISDSNGISSEISATMSRKSITVPLADLSKAFPLPWSHYVRMLSLQNPEGCPCCRIQDRLAG